jgi:hypothetical protein
MRAAAVPIVAMVAAAVAACSIGETNYEKMTLPVRVKKESITCDSPFVTPDVTKRKTCGAGKSHCFSPKNIAFPKQELEACEGDDSCVPDSMLLAGGKAPKSCKFLTGDPGACMSTALKQVAENAAVLKQDVCESDERCLPCIDPRDGSDTHLCEPQGVHEKECVGGVGEEGNVEECCHGMGLCLKQEMVPEESRGDMSREVCSEGKLCAPAAMADKNPTKCDVLGASGVCLDLCFAAMLKGAKPVMGGGCGPTEICMPCILASGRGMPGCD